MLEHRGKPPKQLVHLCLRTSAAVGSALEVAGKSVGEITSVAEDRDKWWAIARVRRKSPRKR